MASSFGTSLDRPPPRRLKFGTLARRCVGSLILLAGAAIITLDMVALATGGDGASPPVLATVDRMHAGQ